VRGTRRKQLHNRRAPQRPPNQAADDDDWGADGGVDNMWVGGENADCRIDACGRVVVLCFSAPQSVANHERLFRKSTKWKTRCAKCHDLHG